MRTKGPTSPLDCSRPGPFLFWLAVGTVLGFVVMAGVARGSWASLLRVGSTNPLLPRVEHELGPLPTFDPLGHDGQLYYLVARDPFGVAGTPEALLVFDRNGPRYRYRRILFPLLAGGLGRLDGRGTLFGMIAWLTLAMGLMAAAIADLCWQLKLREGVVLPAIVNAGALMSLLFLTPDVMALALALGGCTLALREHTGWAIAAFALAAVTKEVYLLVPWSVSAWMWFRGTRAAALSVAALPPLPLLTWSAWVSASFPAPPETYAIFGVPMVGFFEAVSLWVRFETNPVEWSLATFTLLVFLTGSLMLAAGRNALLRSVAAPWLALGCISTAAIWAKPNNASRAFAILWPVGVLLLGERWRGPLRPTQVPDRDPGAGDSKDGRRATTISPS